MMKDDSAYFKIEIWGADDLHIIYTNSKEKLAWVRNYCKKKNYACIVTFSYHINEEDLELYE